MSEDCEAFLAAVRGSRALHRPWITPKARNQKEFTEYLDPFAAGAHYGFLVIHRRTGGIVGVININDVNRGTFQSASLGYYVFSPYAGQGLMSQGMRLVLRRAFGKLKLHRLEANIQPRNAASGSLAPLLPAIGSALLNEGSGQRAAVWDWLKTQPDDEPSKELRRHVLSSAGYQDPALALRLAVELPRTLDGDAEVKAVAQSLFNGGRELHRFNKLFDQAPERMRQPLLEAAFSFLSPETLDNPQSWITRLAELPEVSRSQGVESIARAWAAQAPESAMGWATTLPSREGRTGAVANITSAWAAKDAQGASAWVAAMPVGVERDGSARSLVFAIAEHFPREAWD